MPITAKRRETIQFSRSLLKALDLLFSFVADGEELGISDFEKRVGIKAATAHRFASTLKQAGLLEQNPTSGKYRLGLKILGLSRIVMNGISLRRLALPHLTTLAAESGGNANLGILADESVLYLARVSSPRIQDTYFHAGRKAGLHCTALGKALLAFLPDERSAEIIHRLTLTQHTPNTITDAQTLRGHLHEVRSQRFATDREEFMLGSHCIAAPVRGPEGIAVGAISISTTLLDMSHEQLLQQLPHLLGAARATSYSMGSHLP